MLSFFVLYTLGCGPGDPVSIDRTGQTRVLRDDLGREVALPARVERAVSLAPSLTEIVFAIGAGDRLVGVTSFCDHPEAAKAIAKVGDTVQPNLETILGLDPDVVLVTTSSQIEAFSKILSERGIAVFVTAPDSLDAVIGDLEQLGEVFGTQAAAAAAADGLRNRIKKIEARRSSHADVPVFVQISREPLFTIGKGAFLTTAIKRIKARSVTAEIETPFPKISKETAFTLRPEVIILSEGPDNTEPNAVFASSTAVTKGQVIKVSADLLSRPGPRLVNALEMIEAELERFRLNGEHRN